MIRIKYFPPKGHRSILADFSHYRSLILDFIRRTYPIKAVDQNPDILISNLLDDRCLEEHYRTLVISAENQDLANNENNFFEVVLYKIWMGIFCVLQLDRLRVVQDISKTTARIIGWIFERINRYLRLNYTAKIDGSAILTLKTAHHPFHKNYLTIAKDGSEPHYAIITNDWQGRNILNFPYFFHHCLDRFEDFVKVKQERRYEDKKHFCAFIVGDPRNRGRKFFCQALSRYKEVHCYGRLLNNRTVPHHLVEKYLEKQVSLSSEEATQTCFRGYLDRDNFVDRFQLNQELFRDYKFVICFENSIANDYITEKLPNVMLANSIGIYKGAPNIGDFFNPASFLNATDYDSYQALIDRVIELDQDDRQYRAMLRTPFFVDNRIPKRMKNAKRDLKRFLDPVFKSIID